MRMSASLVAPSAVAILSTALLCSLTGPAMSQTTPGSSSSLPSVTVQAPNQVARHKPVQSANTGAGRRTARATRTRAQQRLGHRRMRRVRSWRNLPSSREPAAIAPMVATRVSSTATNPGMAAPCRGLNLASRIPAETYATTKPTMNARTPLSFWVGETPTPGGIAAACSQGGSWPGRSSSKCGRCAIDPKAIGTSAIAVEACFTSTNGHSQVARHRRESKQIAQAHRGSIADS